MQLHHIQDKIYEIRDQKVMLDFDLAELYDVETRVLNQTVKRNIQRFPERFMFQLTEDERELMSSQIVMTYPIKRPKSSPPYAFTEHGVTMLASVLKSEKAIKVNIAIVDAFISLKEFALNYKELADRLKELEGRFSDVSQAINYLLQKDQIHITQKERKAIGY